MTDRYSQTAEAVVVRLAGRGDRRAFESLVLRRQSWVRNLMRRLSRDRVLADDLAQQVFLQVWRKIGRLQHPDRFPGWLKRVAVNVWLQHLRSADALHRSDAMEDAETAAPGAVGAAVDVDRALAALPPDVRLCIVLSYHARMSHADIAATTAIPLGTVKSHIRRGTERLRALLAPYDEPTTREAAS